MFFGAVRESDDLPVDAHELSDAGAYFVYFRQWMEPLDGAAAPLPRLTAEGHQR